MLKNIKNKEPVIKPAQYELCKLKKHGEKNQKTRERDIITPLYKRACKLRDQKIFDFLSKRRSLPTCPPTF